MNKDTNFLIFIMGKAVSLLNKNETHFYPCWKKNYKIPKNTLLVNKLNTIHKTIIYKDIFIYYITFSILIL